MSLNQFDKYSTSITNKYTSAKEIWNSMCVRFEGTKEEIGESCSNKELVEIKEDEVSTSGRKMEEFIQEEHEEDHLCLMGHELEVSNSNSNNCEFSHEELLDAFHELHDEFEKLILKNKALEKQIKNFPINDSSNNSCDKCVNFNEENESLKDKVEGLEMENEFLKGELLNSKKENEVLKENALSLEKKKSISKENVLKVQNNNLNLKASQNNILKKNKVLKENIFESKRFSNKISKANNFNRKPIFK